MGDVVTEPIVDVATSCADLVEAGYAYDADDAAALFYGKVTDG